MLQLRLAGLGCAWLIGVGVASWARAAPCPPPKLSVVGGSATTTRCAGGPVPTWFADAPYDTWNQVAGDASHNLAHVACGLGTNPPLPQNGGYVSPSSLLDSWDGGAVDQTRNEYLLCANGGHADGADNSCYAISLRADDPKWVRLSDPTPNDQIVFDTNGPGPGATYLDGRPKAMHNTFACFGDGRVWMVLENSSYNPAGNSTDATCAFNRDFPALLTAEATGTPLPWTAANLGPWETYADRTSPYTSNSGPFGSGVFDRVKHEMWGVGGKGPVMWRVSTAGATLGQTVGIYQVGTTDGNGTFGGWAILADDLRLIVAEDSTHQQILVFAIDKAGQIGDSQVVTNVTGTGYFTASGSGGVYIRQNHTILIGDPKDTGAVVYKLQIPVVTDAYDPSGQWIWSQITPSGQAPNTFDNGGANNSAYSKWNLVEDMGNGEGALVFIPGVNGPVYYLKVPVAGL